MILINSNIFFCNMTLDPYGMNRGTILVFEQKKWGDIPRYAHILLYFWPETYTQKEEIRKHDLICYFVYLYIKIPFFVTKKLLEILAIHFTHIIFLSFLLPVILLLICSIWYYYFCNKLISNWKSRLATLKIRIKSITERLT